MFAPSVAQKILLYKDDEGMSAVEVHSGKRFFVETFDIATHKATLAALAPRTGKVLWDVPVAFRESGSALFVRDGLVLRFLHRNSSAGAVYAYDAATGKARWHASIDKPKPFRPPTAPCTTASATPVL